MLCFSGFELYSRWVPLHTLSREIVVALVRTEAWSVELIQDLRAFSELLLLTTK